MEKGKYVSRSEFQKVCEENKRLVNEIRILVDENPSIEKVKITLKWHTKFNEGREFAEFLKEAFSQLKNNK